MRGPITEAEKLQESQEYDELWGFRLQAPATTFRNGETAPASDQRVWLARRGTSWTWYRGPNRSIDVLPYGADREARGNRFKLNLWGKLKAWMDRGGEGPSVDWEGDPGFFQQPEGPTFWEVLGAS